MEPQNNSSYYQFSEYIDQIDADKRNQAIRYRNFSSRKQTEREFPGEKCGWRVDVKMHIDRSS